MSDARGAEDDDHEIARSKRDGINLRAGEVAEQRELGKVQRDEVNAPANEMMLDLANLRAGNRVLDLAAGTGDQTFGGPTRWAHRLRISHGSFYQHAERSCRGGYDTMVVSVYCRGRPNNEASFPGLQRMMAQLNDAERELAWTEIEQQLSQFDGPNGFDAPGEVLIGVGTK